MKASLRRISLLATSIALFSACSSEPISAPQASQIATPTAEPNKDLLGGLLGGVVGIVKKLIVMPGLQRNTALAANITVTKTIGTAGGTLTIPAAGVTVVVPAGALTSNTVSWPPPPRQCSRVRSGVHQIG